MKIKQKTIDLIVYKLFYWGFFIMVLLLSGAFILALANKLKGVDL